MKEKILVSQEAIDAYELATGFVGIGLFFEERGIWTIEKRSRQGHTNSKSSEEKI